MVASGYRRLLVPVDSRPESFHAFELACRLAADERAKITALVVIEVPALLPLDAHMRDEEEAAYKLLERAGATADSFGIRMSARVVRARDPGAAIVQHATSDDVELIVIAAPENDLETSARRIETDVVLRVLNGAPCRVMLVSARSRTAA